MTEQRKSGLKKARSGDMSIFMDEVSNALVNNKNASEIYLAYEKYLIKHGCVPELIEPEFPIGKLTKKQYCHHLAIYAFYYLVGESADRNVQNALENSDKNEYKEIIIHI